MAIGNAVQRGTIVQVYDEKNRPIFILPAGSGANDGLRGYTGSTINIKRGPYIYTYDAKGRQIGMTAAR
ncbi:MAG: hypothetical protein ACP5M5_01240 [Acidibrevibacterium sp.]|uniref:hypothetical protein n=1 Tax=Acidibrevibacterium sp. TaxID=2606776 RepID=UPI003CFDBB79